MILKSKNIYTTIYYFHVLRDLTKFQPENIANRKISEIKEIVSV